MSFQDRYTTWHLAQLKPNATAIAERNLTRQGIRSFLPRHAVTKRQRGRFTTVKAPLFPGYLFVALNTTQGKWRAVNSTQGITQLVSFGGAPASVPQEIVSQLMQRCDRSGLLQATDALSPGDPVKLVAGPFADFIATIEQIDPDRRVWVLMDFMGSQTRIRVDAQHLQKVSP